MPISAPPDPNLSKEMFRAMGDDQLRSGIRHIASAYTGGTERQPNQIMPDTQADQIFETLATRQNVGIKGRDTLRNGLIKIGSASAMDDDDFTPNTGARDDFEDMMVRRGASDLFNLLNDNGSPENRVITDEQADAFVEKLVSVSNVGLRGKEVLRKGLSEVALSRYIDDD